MRFDAKALLVAAALAMSGCAAQVATLSEPRAATLEGGLNVVDARAAADKKSDILSLVITNCNYGIYQAGDDKIVPPRLDLLRDDLNARLGAKVDGKTHAVRVVYSPPEPASAAFGQPASAKAMFAAMRKATDELVAQMP